jgi:hypothetical protein
MVDKSSPFVLFFGHNYSAWDARHSIVPKLPLLPVNFTIVPTFILVPCITFKWTIHRSRIIFQPVIFLILNVHFCNVFQNILYLFSLRNRSFSCLSIFLSEFILIIWAILEFNALPLQFLLFRTVKNMQTINTQHDDSI